MFDLRVRMKTERRNLKMVAVSAYRNWAWGWNVKFIRWDIIGQVYANKFFENWGNDANNLGENIFTLIVEVSEATACF